MFKVTAEIVKHLSGLSKMMKIERIIVSREEFKELSRAFTENSDHLVSKYDRLLLEDPPQSLWICGIQVCACSNS